MLTDGDGTLDTLIAAGGDDGVVIEAAIGPHRGLPVAPA